jgi:hypothetical protein
LAKRASRHFQCNALRLLHPTLFFRINYKMVYRDLHPAIIYVNDTTH